VWIGGAILSLTLLSFFQFPGHTWLRSDTQIYLPILERLWDPSAFARDLLAQHPHVSFTVYDEAALALRRLTGLDFERVLEAQQFLCRALGILGIFLLATALRLSTRMALLAAAIFSLGAFIGGPAVLAIEFEPVPRGFAILLLLLAVGLAANGRYLGAGIAAAAGFLYHAPSVLPFFIVYFALTLWPSEAAVRRQRIWGLVPMLAGVVLLSLLHFSQAGASEAQPFLGRIDPELERIQRLRAPYVWVSLWGPGWVCHYLFLWAASLVALWRVRKPASREACFFLAGLPLVGVLAMPASYLLLEKCKWILMPQIQIARAVLLITVLAGLLASAAAVNAGRQGRWWESASWFLLAFAIPINTLAGGPLEILRELGWMAPACALLAALAVRAESSGRHWAFPVWAAAALVPFFLIPAVHKAAAPPDDVTGLAAWARSATPRDAVFLFPDAATDLYPGVFRARSLRAVYVDWKGGGQVNFLGSFAREWWARWQRVGAGRFDPRQMAAYPGWGIHYFVLQRAHRLPGRATVFEDSEFLVYRP
jgi:hypothetical protein